MNLTLLTSALRSRLSAFLPALLILQMITPLAAQPSPAPATGKPAVLLAGLAEHVLGVEAALKAVGMDAYRCELQTMPGQARLGFSPAFPSLEGVHLVIMADVPSRAFSPADQLRISKFVENGGRLLVFGGFYAFGPGGLKGSFLEDVLPVTTKRTFDRVRVSGELSQPGGSAKLGGCAWVHEVTVKKEAKILWQADAKPGVVSWKFGKGEVIAITATVLGEPANPFWESPAWKDELARLLKPAA